jgi:hypothetical protein
MIRIHKNGLRIKERSFFVKITTDLSFSVGLNNRFPEFGTKSLLSVIPTVPTQSLGTRARERENLMEFGFYSRRSKKFNFRRIAMIFFAVAIIGSNKLIF